MSICTPFLAAGFHLTWVDSLVLLLYLLATIWIGVRAARGQKTEADFLLGGRRMPWFLIAASVVATAFSGISLIGAPGYSFTYDCSMVPGAMIGVLTFPITMSVIGYLRGLQLFTVYEFLEQRFSVMLRVVASGFFLLTKVAYAALVIYTPALLLSTATGYPVVYLVLVLGLLATALSLLGGLKGAVWTDCMQLVVMGVGMGAIVWILYRSNVASSGAMLENAYAAGKARMWNFSFDWKAVTFWALLVNTLLNSVSTSFSDQVQMQYFLSTPKRDIARAFLTSQAIGIAFVWLLFFTGVMLYGFYSVGIHELPEEVRSSGDAVLPYFVSTQLPVGFRGLVVAAMVAATVSTVVSVLNSLAQATTQDFVNRLRSGNGRSEADKVFWSRVVVLGWGGAATLIGCYVGRLGTVIESSQTLAGIIGGGLAGIFFLGFFNRRAVTSDALIGAVIGTAASVWLKVFTEVNFLWYFVAGMGGTVVIAWLLRLNRHSDLHDFRSFALKASWLDVMS